MDHEREGRLPVVVIAVGAVILLPVLYLVSAGPVEWLMAHGYVSYDNPYVKAFYYPGVRLMEIFPPLNDLVRSWLSLWK